MSDNDQPLSQADAGTAAAILRREAAAMDQREPDVAVMDRVATVLELFTAGSTKIVSAD